ncbi:IncI1-type conjugal transfer protein TraR [Escherichia coli]|uniref:IncI1-type conjugal transfer protein TraR n=1 Tax=Escherichia coli TaxID=562 RepID=UPI0013ECE61E|nr:IncI1-type conjugal transfer protein TraR [Escherichia coli]
MSRIRVVAARLYAAFIHAQLFVMSCRSKLTKFLLLIPMMLLPKAVLADGDLADMVRNVEQGAKTQSSSLTIAQFIGVILFLGGLIGLKKVGKQGGMGLASCIVSIVIGAVLVAGPEMMSRSQKQLGISSISIG